MRTLAVAALSGLVALMVAGSASAAPEFSILFSGTTGTGTVGGESIDAVAGDTLTVDVILVINDATDTTGWDFDLLGTNVTALSGTECPGGGATSSVHPTSTNFGANGTCFTTGFASINPLQAGVTVSGSDILNYDAGALPPGISLVGSADLFIGQGVFTVGGNGSIEVSGLFGYPDSSVEVLSDTATIVPEPGTVGLMGLGLAALGLAGRRRS